MVIDFINRADIGMVQGGCAASFAAEAFDRRRVPRQLLRQEFERHVPAEFEIFRLVDHAHTADPQALQNAIVGHHLAGHLGQTSGSPFQQFVRAFPCRTVQHISHGLLCQHFGYFGSNFGIGLSKQRGAFLGPAVYCRIVQRLDLFPLLRRHVGCDGFSYYCAAVLPLHKARMVANNWHIKR